MHCTDCIFILSNLQVLDIFFKNFPNKIIDKPFLVGNFYKHGWFGHLPFYISRCWACNRLFADYPHGHSGRLDCDGIDCPDNTRG